MFVLVVLALAALAIWLLLSHGLDDRAGLVHPSGVREGQPEGSPPTESSALVPPATGDSGDVRSARRPAELDLRSGGIDNLLPMELQVLVTSMDGAPIEGAEVHVYTPYASSREPRNAPPATDAFGLVRLEHPKRSGRRTGEFDVVVPSSARVSCTVADNESFVQVVVPDTDEFVLEIVDERGLPVLDADAQAELRGGEALVPCARENNTLVFRGLPRDYRTLVVFAPGRESVSILPFEHPGTRAVRRRVVLGSDSLRIRLVYGRVVDSSGRGVAGAAVRNTGVSPPMLARTGPDGAFVMGLSRSSSMPTWYAHKDGVGKAWLVVADQSVGSSPEDPIEFVLAPVRTLVVRVEPWTANPCSFKCELYALTAGPPAGAQRIDTQSPDDTGRVSFELREAHERYRVVLRAGDVTVGRGEIDDASIDEQGEFALDGSSIGFVHLDLRNATGRALQGSASLRALAGDRAGSRFHSRPAADGRLVVAALVGPGLVTVTYGDWRHTVAVDIGPMPLELDIEVPDGRTIEGRIVDRVGEPVAGAVLLMRVEGGREVSLRTAADGHFRLHGVPVAAVRLFGTHSAKDLFTLARIGPAASGDLGDLLWDFEQVSVRVVDLDERPLAHVFLHADGRNFGGDTWPFRGWGPSNPGRAVALEQWCSVEVPRHEFRLVAHDGASHSAIRVDLRSEPEGTLYELFVFEPRSAQVVVPKDLRSQELICRLDLARGRARWTLERHVPAGDASLDLERCVPPGLLTVTWCASSATADSLLTESLRVN